MEYGRALALVGGLLALVEEGDPITIDSRRLLLQLEVDDATIAARRARWSPPAPRYTRGVLAKFAKLAAPCSPPTRAPRLNRRRRAITME